MILSVQGVNTAIKDFFQLEHMLEQPNFGIWKTIAFNIEETKLDNSKLTNIAIVGKYTGLSDSYLSVIKALQHSGIHLKRTINIVWIDATELEKNDIHSEGYQNLINADGVVVPGGFGNRGVEGKIIAANYCRTHKKPFLGICLGMQVMVIEFARNMLNISHATSEEFTSKSNDKKKTKENNVIIFMPEGSKTKMGGTMRLGASETIIQKKSFANEIYSENNNLRVIERHRHRYEVSPNYICDLQEKGLLFSGKDTTGMRMEIVELDKDTHPFYFGTQFHPEFTSKPHKPSPPFYKFIAVASGQTV